jgi:hypothetical protein
MHYSVEEADQMNTILKYAIEHNLSSIVDLKVKQDVLPNITQEECTRLLEIIALKIHSAKIPRGVSGGRYGIWISEDVKNFYKAGGF